MAAHVRGAASSSSRAAKRNGPASMRIVRTTGRIMRAMAQATLSTHVIDIAFGKPRSGIRVALFQAEHLVAHGETGADGRIAELAKDLEPGSYRLVFSLGGAFIEEVALVVRVDHGHYHVPLLVSPFGVTTYRGS
jgi:5-hydroxyisourate hydrolase